MWLVRKWYSDHFVHKQIRIISTNSLLVLSRQPIVLKVVLTLMIWKDAGDLILHILQQFQPKSTVWKETSGSRRNQAQVQTKQSNQKESKRQRVKQNLFQPVPNNPCQPTSLCSQSKIVQTALNTPLPYKESLNGEIKEGVNEKNMLLVATISKASIHLGFSSKLILRPNGVKLKNSFSKQN